MTLVEYYNELKLLIAGNDEVDGFCLQLRKGNWNEANYSKIVKLLKDANKEILSSGMVNSEDCLRIVDYASQFYGEAILYFIREGIKDDKYVKVIADFQNTFGVPFVKKETNKINLKDYLEKILFIYREGNGSYDSNLCFGRFDKEQFDKLYNLFKEVAVAIKNGATDECLSTILGIYSNFSVDTTALLIANDYKDADVIIKELENLF